MTRLSVLLLALSASACVSTGTDPDGNPTPGDGGISVSFASAVPSVDPLFAAIDFGNGWQSLDVTGDEAEADVPEGATDYTLVVVCPTSWDGGTDVDWFFASTDVVPEPGMPCATPDVSGAVTVTGDATGILDLVTISIGMGEDTFFAGTGETFSLVTPPGVSDLIVRPEGSPASANQMLVRAGLDLGADTNLTTLDFATEVVTADAVGLTVTGGTPTYTEVTAWTTNGTHYLAGSNPFYVPPAATGIGVLRRLAMLRFAGADQFVATDATGDWTIEATTEAAFPFSAVAETGANAVDLRTEAILDAWQANMRLTRADFTESRVRATVVGRTGEAITVPTAPDIAGFPAEASGGTIGPVSAEGVREGWDEEIVAAQFVAMVFMLGFRDDFENAVPFDITRAHGTLVEP